jgi:hypothetical protein
MAPFLLQFFNSFREASPPPCSCASFGSTSVFVSKEYLPTCLFLFREPVMCGSEFYIFGSLVNIQGIFTTKVKLLDSTDLNVK